MTTQQISQKIAVAPPSAPDRATAKLVDASQQFEAMMLNEMLKPLQFGAGVDAGGEESAGGAADTIHGMGTDALGKALSSHGGLGIAKKIVGEITAQHEAETKRKGVLKSNGQAPI
jgi:Rod binding domain-containing protein